MSKIYGNNFLTNIAWFAESPSHAANIAQLAGYDSEIIRQVRQAAKLKRDSGESAFLDSFEPFERIDPYISSYPFMHINLRIDKLYEKRNLNAAEYNQIASEIESLLLRFGISGQISKVSCPPQIKSTLKDI